MMRTYKVGDLVRCNEDINMLKKDQVYVVTSVNVYISSSCTYIVRSYDGRLKDIYATGRVLEPATKLDKLLAGMECK